MTRQRETILSREEYVKHLARWLTSISEHIVELEQQVNNERWCSESRYGEPQYYYPLSEKDLILVREDLIEGKKRRERILLKLGNALLPFEEIQKNTDVNNDKLQIEDKKL